MPVTRVRPTKPPINWWAIAVCLFGLMAIIWTVMAMLSSATPATVALLLGAAGVMALLAIAAAVLVVADNQRP